MITARIVTAPRGRLVHFDNLNEGRADNITRSTSCGRVVPASWTVQDVDDATAVERVTCASCKAWARYHHAANLLGNRDSVATYMAATDAANRPELYAKLVAEHADVQPVVTPCEVCGQPFESGPDAIDVTTCGACDTDDECPECGEPMELADDGSLSCSTCAEAVLTLTALEQAARAAGLADAGIVNTGGGVMSLSFTVDGAQALVCLDDGHASGSTWTVALDGDTREQLGEDEHTADVAGLDAAEIIRQAVAWVAGDTTPLPSCPVCLDDGQPCDSADHPQRAGDYAHLAHGTRVRHANGDTGTVLGAVHENGGNLWVTVAFDGDETERRHPSTVTPLAEPLGQAPSCVSASAGDRGRHAAQRQAQLQGRARMATALRTLPPAGTPSLC